MTKLLSLIKFQYLLSFFMFLSVFLFSSNFYKPFTFPKVLSLYTFIFFSIIYVILFVLPRYQFENLKIWILPLVFILILLFYALNSSNLYLALFGSYGRFTGFLFWFSLFSLMFISAITFENGKILINSLVYIGVCLTAYSILQYFDSSIVLKSSSYKIIGTLGNPNYVSTLLGITATLTVWKILKERIVWKKISFVILLSFSLFVITQTKSTQGLFIFIICTAVYGISRIIFINRKLGVLLSVLLISALSIGVLGLLQLGPLNQFLYQYSISLRGDYWRAAINMFKSDIYKGVGIERYGLEFLSYRDATAVLRPDSKFTDDPHNEILYFLSGGGIPLALSYILVLALVLGISIFGLRKSNIHNRDYVLILLAAWLGFRIESVISVNQVTNNVVEWIIAGALIALSINLKEANKRVKIKLINLRLIYFKISILMIFTLFFTSIFILPKSKADINYANYNRNLGSGMSDQTLEDKKILITKVIAQEPREFIYLDSAARFMINTDDIPRAEAILDSLIRLEPNYYGAYVLQAEIFEREANLELAIKSRMKVFEIDPFDRSNIQSLKDLYLRVEKFDKYSEFSSYLEEINP